MRVIECNLCGEALSAANDDELIAAARRHMDERHPDDAPDDAAVQRLVAEHVYDATDS